MFDRHPELDAAGSSITIVFDGEKISVHQGDTVIAALLMNGHTKVRQTPVTGAARGAFCLMGVCFDCLLEIDGQLNRQGCMTLARDGMEVRSMPGAREAGQ